MCFCEICVIVVIFSCELFSWERLSWSLYCDSFVASHITDHGEWWFKLRPRCFVNSQLLWYYRRWRICSSIWRLFVKTYFPILEIPQIQCRRVKQCGVQDRASICGETSAWITWMFRNSGKKYMRTKNSMVWDGGPVHFVEEVGIPL